MVKAGGATLHSSIKDRRFKMLCGKVDCDKRCLAIFGLGLTLFFFLSGCEYMLGDLTACDLALRAAFIEHYTCMGSCGFRIQGTRIFVYTLCFQGFVDVII